MHWEPVRTLSHAGRGTLEGRMKRRQWEKGKASTLQPQDRGTCRGTQEPCLDRAEPWCSSAREPRASEQPGCSCLHRPACRGPGAPPEMNPGLFVSRSGVWMAQDRWGLGCGEKRSIWVKGTTIGGKMPPPKIFRSKFLASANVNVTVFGKKGFADVIQLKIFFFINT